MPFETLSIYVIILVEKVSAGHPCARAGLFLKSRQGRPARVPEETNHERFQLIPFQPPGWCCHQRPHRQRSAGGTAHRPLCTDRPSARRGRPCRRTRRQPHRHPRCAERDGACGLHRAGARHRHSGQPKCPEPAQPVGPEAGVLPAHPQLWQLPPRRRHPDLPRPRRRRAGP